MNRKRKDPQAEADAWNNAHPIGTVVDYSEVVGHGSATRHATTTPAQVLSGHTAVVWLEGKRGCVVLSHCTAVPGAAVAAPAFDDVPH